MTEHMKEKKQMQALIAAKRASCNQKKPTYGLRKLSVGLVSCLVGFLLFFAPGTALAQELPLDNGAAEFSVGGTGDGSASPTEEADATGTDAADPVVDEAEEAVAEESAVPAEAEPLSLEETTPAEAAYAAEATPEAVEVETRAAAAPAAPDTTTSTREAGEYGTKDHVSGAINADAIANGYIDESIDLTNAKHTLSGKAVVIMGGTASSGDMASNSDPGAPDGTVVYMQWRDTDGWVSPVYRAVTHTLSGKSDDERESTRGTYAFEVPDEVDMNGKVRSWNAQSGTFYRVWCEPQYRTYDPALEHDTGNVLVPLRYGGARSDKWTRVATAGGAFQFAGVNVQKVGIFMTELPLEKIDDLGNPAGENYMKATGEKLIKDTQGFDSTPLTGNKNSVSGKVYFETGDKAADTGTLTVNYVGDPVAVGYKVFMTVLTEEGKAEVKKIEVGSNAERLIANKKIKDLIKAHPEYIEATYWTYTNGDGNYTLRATKENTAFDRDYLYMWVEDPTNGQIKPAFSAFVAGPRFVMYNENGTGWEPTPLANPGANEVVANMDFGISVADFATLDVLNYSNTNPANVGDTVKIKVDGSMHLDTVIKIMHDGKQVGDDIPVTIDNLVDPYSWVVPEGAEGGVYVAELHNAGNMLAADSFMVVADDKDGDGDPDPVDPDTGNDGEKDDPNKKVDPDDPDTPEVEGTQHLTHGIALIGKGEDTATVVTSDGDNATHKELIVNEEGDPAEGGADLSGITVTLTAGDVKVTSGTADTWRGTDGLPLVQNFDLHNFGQADYEVTVTENVKNWAVTKASELANGKTIKVDGNVPNLGLELGYDSDDDGIADVDEKDAEQYEPNAVADKSGNMGTAITTDPVTFDDVFTEAKEQLSPTAADSPLTGTSFALAADAPAGATINATTGAITVPDTAQAGTYTFEITVTYPDSTKENPSTDTVTVKVTVTATLADTLKAEGGEITVPESISDEDLTDALKGAVEVTDDKDKPVTDDRVKSITVKGDLPEKKGTKDVTMVVTYKDNSSEEVTVTANFVADVVPVPDPTKPPVVPEDYVKVSFAAGDHGKLADGETAVFMVNPEATVDLTDKAPDVTADAGWTFNGWDKALKGTFAAETTITATYTQNPTLAD
ncbi:MAG: Rib/alpha-like domain-containing protein, partial [Atopobiaceae bacterium]|nr:Rib/alpha-like domain-containing protein [Atopobiaceae bacterium]